MKHVYTFLVFLSCYLGNALAQTGNVGIGTSSPNSSSILDVTSSNKGLLVPRVALTGTTDASTISSPATSLLVYNTATTGTAPYNVTPGYYYNGGTTTLPNWVRIDIKANNGLTKNGDNVQLGGVLIQPTTVSGLTATNKMSFTGSGVDAFNVDGTTFSIDADNNRVGIGTAAPNENLSIAGNASITSTNTLEFGKSVSGKQTDAGKIGYQTWTTGALDIVGAGTSGNNRVVKLWDSVRVSSLVGTGTRPVSANANGTLVINNKLRETTVHDFYLPTYKSCGGCDKFMWFPRPGGSSGDDEDDSPLYERNMWIAPYSGRIVSITLAVDPTSSNSGVEISNGRFVFEHDNTLSESGVIYYTNMLNGSYTDASNWQGGEYTTVYGSPSYTISSPNRGRFSVNESQKIRWDSKGSTLFSFTKGQTLALGLSANYIEDNSYLITVVWEYDVDDY